MAGAGRLSEGSYRVQRRGLPPTCVGRESNGYCRALLPPTNWLPALCRDPRPFARWPSVGEAARSGALEGLELGSSQAASERWATEIALQSEASGHRVVHFCRATAANLQHPFRRSA